MIIVFGTMEFTEDNFASAREAAGRLTEKSRAESGCLAYRFSQDITDSFMLNFYEEWKDPKALEDHKATLHNLAFKDALANLAPLSRTVKKYQVEGPAEGL